MGWDGSLNFVNIAKIFEATPRQYVSDYLASMQGVSVDMDGYINIRSSIHLMNASLPLVLIDGINFPWPIDSNEMAGDDEVRSALRKNRYSSPLEQVPISDIESIDVFVGTSAAAFGGRGGNGVI